MNLTRFRQATAQLDSETELYAFDPDADDHLIVTGFTVNNGTLIFCTDADDELLVKESPQART